jgi:hypothetical protein
MADVVIALFLGIKGPLITIPAAILFIWTAISGIRPAFNSSESSEALGVGQRIFWGLAGIGALLYEASKLLNWMHSPHN